MKLTITTGFDVAVVGTDGERADYDNPQGHIFGNAWFVEMTNDHGRRWRRHVGVNCENQADLIAQSERATLAGGGKLDAGLYVETYPVYGSPCYQREWSRWEDKEGNATGDRW